MKTLITQTAILIAVITILFSALGKMDWSIFLSISFVAVAMLLLVKLYSSMNALKSNIAELEKDNLK